LLPVTAGLTFTDISNSVGDFWLNYGAYVILVSTVSVVLLVFELLLSGKHEDKRRLYVSLLLVVVGSILTTVFSPLSKEWNTLIIGAFLTPLVAYLIDFLRDKREFSNQKDKLSYEYRCQQVERESNIIGELLGELSTHAAALKSYGFQEIGDEKWRASFKTGLISDIQTLSVARYYYFVPMYNRAAKDLDDLRKKHDANKIQSCLDSFVEVKSAFLETETAIFLTLIYDLGLLQHSYLARPTVEFPLHMSILLKRQLERFEILKEDEEIELDKLFSDNSSEKFNKLMVKHLNACYATVGLKLKELEKKISETQRNPPKHTDK
jgi:hypothetical protein